MISYFNDNHHHFITMDLVLTAMCSVVVDMCLVFDSLLSNVLQYIITIQLLISCCNNPII